MIGSEFQRVIYKQQERELMRKIELNRKIREAGGLSAPERGWIVKIEDWLKKVIAGFGPGRPDETITATGCGCITEGAKINTCCTD